MFRQRASCLRHAEHKRPGKKSGADDLEEAPRWIGYSLKPLDKIPSYTDLMIACSPVKVQVASAGWCRPVALV